VALMVPLPVVVATPVRIVFIDFRVSALQVCLGSRFMFI
jgi:hypothetical protein